MGVDGMIIDDDRDRGDRDDDHQLVMVVVMMK